MKLNQKLWDEFLNGKIVVNTPTQKEAEELLKMVDERGFRWRGGQSTLAFTNWKIYGEKTCYCLLGSLTYCTYEYYLDNEYEVIKYSDLFEKERNYVKLKVELFRYHELVFGKIMEQDENLRDDISYEYNGYRIRSGSIPNIDDYTLYICGKNRIMDDRVIINRFDSEDKAKEWCKNIKILIDKINYKLSIDDTKEIEKVI